MYDLPFNFEEYIDHRELIVCGFERLEAKHYDKRVRRGRASVAKGSINTAGGGAAAAASGAAIIAADAAATAAATSCAVTAASAASTAATAAAAASVAAVAAPVVVGVGLAMGIGMYAGKYFVDQSDKAEFLRLGESLKKLEETDRLINEKITEIQKADLIREKQSEVSFGGVALNTWNVWQAQDAALEIKGEVGEALDALKAVGDGHCNASDLELMNKAVGDGTILAAEGTSAAVAVAGGLGIFGMASGIWDISSGVKEIRNVSDFEKSLAKYVEALRAQCRLIRQHKAHFRGKGAKRGRLTYINGGGGCARNMRVTYCTAENKNVKVQSDASHVVVLPEGAHSVRIRFSVQGGSMARKVDRHNTKQPWIVPPEEEEINIPHADGINVVFELRGTSLHSYVHKAWNFDKNVKHTCNSSRENWEWCGDRQDQASLLSRAKYFWVRCVHEWVRTFRHDTASSRNNEGAKLGRLTYING